MRTDSKLIGKLAEALQCSPEELAGKTLRELFEAAERQGGITVYWGFWTDRDLNQVVGPAA